MYYEIIDNNGLEVLVDRKAWENYLRQFVKRDTTFVSKQELLADFRATYR